MKTINKIKIAVVSSLAALPVMAGSGVIIQVGVPPPPVVVVAPAPAVTVVVGVPDYYVWDGFEFVGVVGTQYFYLGVGNVWIVCDPVRVERFHVWEKSHADWRAHAIHNESYRRDAKGHEVPLRAPAQNDHAIDHSHDVDNHDPGHDKDPGH